MLLRTAFILSLIVCLLTAIGSFVVAQQIEKPADKKFTVGVVANNEDFDLWVASYIKRELRGLGDVKVIDGSAQWTLRLLGLESETTIVIAVVIINNATYRILEVIEAELGSPPKKEVIDRLSKEMRSVLFTQLIHEDVFRDSYISPSVSKEHIGILCEALVTKFDIEYLEPERSK